MTSPTPYPPGQPGGLPPGLTPGGPPPAAPPSGGWIPVGAGGAPTPPVVPVGAAGGGGRKGRPALTILGIVLILAGIGGAIGLAVAGSQRYADGIERLARGPANCATTLEVDQDATYYFYVETKGEVGDLRGSCPASGESYDGGDGRDADLSLKDDDGDAVRLRRAAGVTYSSGGYDGELVRSARLDAGRYSLTVEGDDDIVVAVGRDVDGLKTNLLLPIIVGAAGLVLGLALIMLGRRGGRPAVPAGSGPTGPQPSGWTDPLAGSGLSTPTQPMPTQPAPPATGWGGGFQPPPPPNA